MSESRLQIGTSIHKGSRARNSVSKAGTYQYSLEKMHKAASFYNAMACGACLLHNYLAVRALAQGFLTLMKV